MERQDTETLETQLDMILKTYCPKNKPMLVEFGQKYGFLSIASRYQAYSCLLQIDEEEVIEFNQKAAKLELKDVAEVIKMDCDRSYSFFEKSVKLGKKESLENKRKELEVVLHIYLAEHQEYGYYQGLNFIAELFCMTYGKNLGYILMSRFIELYFHRFMKSESDFEKNIKNTIDHCLMILRFEVPFIFEILNIEEDATASMGFLISMVLTWAASRIKDVDMVFRIYDFMLCAEDHNAMVAHLLASICLEIVKINDLNPSKSTFDVTSTFYNYDLSNINIEKVLARALEYSKRKEYSRSTLLKNNQNSSLDRILDLLETPVKKITKEKFTKMENVTLLFVGLSVLGSLLALGLSKLKK